MHRSMIRQFFQCMLEYRSIWLFGVFPSKNSYNSVPEIDDKH